VDEVKTALDIPALPISIANGGTGATTATAALTALGAAPVAPVIYPVSTWFEGSPNVAIDPATFLYVTGGCLKGLIISTPNWTIEARNRYLTGTSRLMPPGSGITMSDVVNQNGGIPIGKAWGYVSGGVFGFDIEPTVGNIAAGTPLIIEIDIPLVAGV
jgi:hypothetical protein